MEEFFNEIKHINYVVQRNWDNLPESPVVGEHDDLDLFVEEGHREKLEKVLKKYPEIDNITDVRSYLDRYYPWGLGVELLDGRILYKNTIWIPNPTSHFLSLYYHNRVHKDNNPYGEKLDSILFDVYEPVKCIDKGVGYYINA